MCLVSCSILLVLQVVKPLAPGSAVRIHALTFTTNSISDRGVQVCNLQLAAQSNSGEAQPTHQARELQLPCQQQAAVENCAPASSRSCCVRTRPAKAAELCCSSCNF